jgi:alanine dehydrogenase
MGASVAIADISIPRLRQLRDVLAPNIATLYSTRYNIKKQLPTVDLVIGAALVPGTRTPHLITKDMLKLVKPGTVLVDVAIDQGGCFESSHPITHSDPIFFESGILHDCVANIPGAGPYTSTPALANTTLPYAVRIVNFGARKHAQRTQDALTGSTSWTESSSARQSLITSTQSMNPGRLSKRTLKDARYSQNALIIVRLLSRNR